MASETAPPPILVYSTPTCPDCRALKAWLEANDIPFVERDLSDPAIVEEAKSRTGVRVAPISIVGDVVLYGTFAGQRPRLEELLRVPPAFDSHSRESQLAWVARSNVGATG